MIEEKYVTEDMVKYLVNVAPDEKETTINIFNPNDLNVYLFTRDNKMITKMKRLMRANPDQYKCKQTSDSTGNVISYEFTFPKKLLRFGSKTRTRQMTEEQKKAVGERFKKAREDKK